MSLEVIFTFFYVQTFLSALIAGFAFYNYRRRDRLMVLVGLLFTFSFLLNVAQLVAYKFGQNVLMNRIGGLYDCVFLVMAGIMFDHATQKKFRTPIAIVTGFFLLLWVFNMLILQKTAVTSITKLACDIIVVVYCVSFFYRLMVELPAVHLHRLTMFWVASGFLLYAAGTIFLFAFTEYVINQLADKFALLWTLNLTLFILQQLFIVVAVINDVKKLGESKAQIH
ncbi:MAG TPA: hypothetical protein VGD40_19305 [Chryseosolibacter sp.]